MDEFLYVNMLNEVLLTLEFEPNQNTENLLDIYFLDQFAAQIL